MNRFSENNHSWYQLPGINTLQSAYEHMGRFERGILYIFAILLIVSTIGILSNLNTAISTTVPTTGGTHTEGIVGFPRFINPVLASSDADRALTELVYAGLMHSKEDGTLVPELASSYNIENNGRTYTFTIRQNARFHDGHPVTAEDVVFTVRKVQEGGLRSPKQSNWEGVEVVADGERTVVFTLQDAYAPFLENTTLGILPKHRWSDTGQRQFTFSRLNTRPIGAGPYEVTNLVQGDGGVPQSYTLQAFDQYVNGEPFISTLETRFFSNAESLIAAYTSGKVDAAAGIDSNNATKLKQDDYRIATTTLPRVFGIFFNQNQAPLFTNMAVRKALNTAIDRKQIVTNALAGYGSPVAGPLPATTGLAAANTSAATNTASRIQTAIDTLETNGWERNNNGTFTKPQENGSTTLSFSIATANTSELRSTATSVERMWERMGADVTVELFQPGNLSQDVIRPREYDALLFGQVVGRQQDMYPFWHSSQRNDPGLNVAMYANITVDDLLEEIRTTTKQQQRRQLLEDFQSAVMDDAPAAFLYSPDFIYALPEQLYGIDLGIITTPAERFSDVHTWYKQTDSVWTIFAEEKARSNIR